MALCQAKQLIIAKFDERQRCQANSSTYKSSSEKFRFFSFLLIVIVQQEEEDEEDYDIPDQIETIIELLLAGLKDRDTIIRWSAAKGLGRITNRLPLNLAEDVIKFILELYAPG